MTSSTNEYKLRVHDFARKLWEREILEEPEPLSNSDSGIFLGRGLGPSCRAVSFACDHTPVQPEVLIRVVRLSRRHRPKVLEEEEEDC